MELYRPYLNGKFSEHGRRTAIRRPFDQQPWAEVLFGDSEMLAEAIGYAAAARDVARDLPSHAIARILRSVAGRLAEEAEAFARVLAQEAGKPLRSARAEVQRAVHTFEIGAEESLRIGGETIAMDQRPHGDHRFGQIQPFPLGVVAAITPFNFPLNLVAHKIAPALASRNCLVLKPASQTPVSALKLAQLFDDEGLSAGLLQVIPATGRDAELLATDDRVAMITFTGSAAIGWRLKQLAYRKKVALELGGNAAVIVEPEVDIHAVARSIANAAFLYAGQSCISVQRVWVHDSIYDAMRQALIDYARAYLLGDPLDEQTDIGPLIHSAEGDRIRGWIDEAVRDGARIVCGGQSDGPLFQPTILENTTAVMRVNCQEIFGPVLTLTPYTDFGAALAAVNASRYGLQAGVYTRDVSKIRLAYTRLDVGGVIINDVPTYRIDHMPYGGVKESGCGREGIRYAMAEMSEPKLLVINFQ